MSVSQEEAEEIIFKLVNEDFEKGLCEDNFVISHVSLDNTASYWVIGSNSEAFVKHGVFGKCYVGLQAHLVDVDTGEIHTVGSGQDLDEVIQDLLDEKIAGRGVWYIKPLDDADHKKQILNLRRFCTISMSDAKRILRHKSWFKGKKRELESSKVILKEFGVATEIILSEQAIAIPDMQDASGWGVKEQVTSLIQQISVA